MSLLFRTYVSSVLTNRFTFIHTIAKKFIFPKSKDPAKALSHLRSALDHLADTLSRVH